MDEVLWFLGECWKDLGRPEQVQLENARELAGWGPAARTLSRVIRPPNALLFLIANHSAMISSVT
jgi:hypothetical protein